MSGSTAASRAPLAGVRIVDLSRLLPGPMCTLYFAQLCADVIKVEDTGAGDYARNLSTREPAPFFTLVNRGKRSIAVDLKTPRGREVFEALVRTADVLVESFRPGVMRALNVDAPRLCAINPRLVYASISGYGQDGPRAQAPGNDINYLGYAGVLDQIGERDGAPALANLQIADLLGGASVPALAILAALYDAQRTGAGRYVDVAMADATLAHNVFPLQALAASGSVAARGDDMLTGGIPCYGVYATQDGRYVAVGALEEKFWRTLCETLHRPDLVPYAHARGEVGARTRQALSDVFVSRPLAHWQALFDGVDCCVSPVATLEESLADPQFVARGMVHRHPSGVPVYGAPFRISGHSPDVVAPAPRQGEHTAVVLRELGYDDPAIAELYAARAVA